MRGDFMTILFCRRAAITFSILALCVTTAIAQSGRKNTGGSTTTTVTPSVSGPKPVEKKPEVSKRIQLLVGIDKHQVFATVPFYLYDTVLDNCIRRLGEADIVMPTSVGSDFNRAAAIKAAKQETVRYVVLLNLGSEYADAGRQVKNGQDELYVDYVMFEPETAKVKASGRTHQHIYQTGRGGISLPSKNSPIYSEYAIKQAAIEAANRILGAFDIKVRGEGPF
jgi:hypothetical protein